MIHQKNPLMKKMKDLHLMLQAPFQTLLDQSLPNPSFSYKYFINTSGIGTFYEDTFDKYGITHVITYKNSKMNMIITKTHDEKLKELYSDDHFVVYERN